MITDNAYCGVEGSRGRAASAVPVNRSGLFNYDIVFEETMFMCVIDYWPSES